MKLLVLALLAAACGRAPSQADRPPPEDGGQASVGPADAGAAPDADAGVAPDAGVQATRLGVPEAGRLYHGVIPIGDSHQVSPAALDAYVQAVGRNVAWVYFDDEWHDSRAFPADIVAWVHARGAVPFVRLMLRSQKVPLVTDPVFTLDRILAGEFDADLQAWADAAASQGPIIVEYGTEVNGDWNPWSAPYNGGLDKGPPLFARAYRHIVEVMRPRAPNITWALHFNSQSFPEDPRNVPASYYPGDDVVDWIGLSVYGSERSTDHRCPTFRSLVDAMLPLLPAAKPHFIFEFGNTNNNPGCPVGPWVSGALGDLVGGRWPSVRGFSWWQQKFADDPSAGGSTDYLVQDDADVLAAFRSALASPSIVDAPLLVP